MKTKILAALLALMPAAAFAELDYSYLEVATGDYETEDGGFSFEGDGLALRGALTISDTSYLSFDYDDSTLTLTIFPVDVDVTAFSMRFGTHSAVSERTDFYAEFGFESATLDDGGLVFGSVNDMGYSFELGLRSQLGERFELNGRLGYANLGDLDTMTTVGVGAAFALVGGLSATVDYAMRNGDAFGDMTMMTFGLRYGF